MHKSTLFLLVGIPGAGKTTASKLIADITGASHIWADHERRTIHRQPTYTQQENDELYNRLNSRADELLQRGSSVIFDTAFNHYHDRQKLREIATMHNAQTVVIWVQVPKSTAKLRAQNSHHHSHTRILGDMSDEHFHALSDKLEEPKAHERTIILDGTKLTKPYVSEKLSEIL